MKKPENKIYTAALKWVLAICAILLLLLIPHSSIAKKIVKEKQTVYSSKREMVKELYKSGRHYILFAGDYCPHCRSLIARMKKANLIDPQGGSGQPIAYTVWSGRLIDPECGSGQLIA